MGALFNTLKRLLFRKRPMEDAIQVQIRAELLKEKYGGEWAAIDGYYAITKVSMDAGGQLTFYASSGIVMKAFYEKESGEIKLFPASMFERQLSPCRREFNEVR